MFQFSVNSKQWAYLRITVDLSDVGCVAFFVKRLTGVGVLKYVQLKSVACLHTTRWCGLRYTYVTSE